MLTLVGDGPLARLCRTQALNKGVCIADDLENVSRNSTLLFSVQFPRKIDDYVLGRYRLCLNLHTGLLPNNGGVHTCSIPILRGHETTGVTIHEMTSKLDAGDILLVDEYTVSEFDTCETLYYRGVCAGAGLFKRALDLLHIDSRGNIAESSLTTLCSLRKPQGGRPILTRRRDIDFTAPIEATDPLFMRKVRAYFFPQRQLPTVRSQGKVFQVTSVHPLVMERLPS